MYKSLFLLDGLGEAEKEKIISSFPAPQSFKNGETIYSADGFFRAIGLLLSGSAVAVTDNKQKLVMNRFSAGMCFGAAAVFGEGKQYISTIVAESDTEILFFTEEYLKKLFKDYPQTAINYIAFLSDKIRFLNKKLSVVSCQNAEDSVYKYLLNLAGDDGYAILPVSMTELSKMLGLGRASLYRSLDTLEANGKIKRENNKFKVIQNEKTN